VEELDAPKSSVQRCAVSNRRAVAGSAALEDVEAVGHVATEHAELLEAGAGLAAVRVSVSMPEG
jgi:hypothetical protein